MRRILKLFVDRRGASAIEYALIASLISVAAIVGYQNLGEQVENSFEETHQALEAGQ